MQGMFLRKRKLMDLVNIFSMEFSKILVPWIILLISIVITMWIKDWIQSFVNGK